MSDSPPSGGVLPTHIDRLLVGGVPARLALTVLALAEESGLPTALWRSGTVALAGPGSEAGVTEEQLREFAAGPRIAGAVVEPGTGDVHRMSPPAIEEVLPAAPASRSAIQARLTAAWLAHGRAVGWPNAPGYLLRALPAHALGAGLVDALLEDDGYLAYADLERLTPAARHARTRAGRLRRCLLESAAPAASVTGAPRTAMLSVTDVLEGLGTGAGALPAPYRGLWARTGARAERHELTGHTDDVGAACQVTVAGEPVLATGGSDATVRLWDPVTARLDRVLDGHSGRVAALCAVGAGGRELLASGGADLTVRLWDPVSAQVVHLLAGHTQEVTALCRVVAPEGECLASGGSDFTVRLWDPATGLTVHVLTGHTGSVTALCVATVDGRTLLASASWDGTVRLWDPWTGRPVGEHALRGERGMCFLTAGGRPLLATAGADDSVRLLDLTADARPEVIGTGLVVDALCPVRVGGRSLLAAAENDGPYRHVVRLWDPASRRRPRQMDGGDAAGAMCEVSFGGRTRLAIATANGDPSAFTPGTGTVLLTEPDGRQPPMRAVSHTGPVTALAEVPVGGRTLVASASADHSVRFWDPATGRAVSVADGHVTEVRALSAVPGGLLASAGDTTVRIWNPETGEAVAVLRGHEMAIAAVCPVTVDGRPLIASGGYDRTIRLWDPRTGRTVRALEHPGGVYVLRTLELDGRTVLVSAGAEGALLLWDPATGSVLRRMEGHTGWISGVCLTGASPLLASAGSDGTVRLWDPGTGSPTQVLAGHTGGARGVCPVTVQGTRLLASAGADAQVRLWDPATGRLRTTIPVRDPATACAEADGTLVVGLDTGVLAVRLAGPRRTGTGAVRGRGREVRGGEPRARRRTYGPCGRGTRRSADRCTGEGPVGTGGGRGHGRSP